MHLSFLTLITFFTSKSLVHALNYDPSDLVPNSQLSCLGTILSTTESVNPTNFNATVSISQFYSTLKSVATTAQIGDYTVMNFRFGQSCTNTGTLVPIGLQRILFLNYVVNDISNSVFSVNDPCQGGLVSSQSNLQLMSNSIASNSQTVNALNTTGLPTPVISTVTVVGSVNSSPTSQFNPSAGLNLKLGIYFLTILMATHLVL